VALSLIGWQGDIYDWQPTLERGGDLGVILPGELSALVAAHLTDHTIHEKTVHDLLAEPA
jgi:hypothetical protein